MGGHTVRPLTQRTPGEIILTSSLAYPPPRVRTLVLSVYEIPWLCTALPASAAEPPAAAPPPAAGGIPSPPEGGGAEHAAEDGGATHPRSEGSPPRLPRDACRANTTPTANHTWVESEQFRTTKSVHKIDLCTWPPPSCARKKSASGADPLTPNRYTTDEPGRSLRTIRGSVRLRACV